MKNKKGFGNQLMIVLILAVVLAIGILIFWAGAMVLPLLTGTGNTLLNTIQTSVNANNPSSDLANATNITVNISKNILGIVETIVYISLFILMIGYITLCFYVRTYPFLAFFWIFIVVGLVFVSMFVSNAYMLAKQDSNLADFYSTWGTNSLLMENLPVIVAFFGVISGIFLFVLATKDQEGEVQQL